MTDALHIFDAGSPPGLPAGIHLFGIQQGGALGADIPATGEHGPSYLYPSLDLPADADDYFYGVITAIPPSLQIEADEYGRVTGTGSSDGEYTVPFDLYRNFQLVGSTYFRFNFGVVGATVGITAAAIIQANTISGAAVTVSAGSSFVNLSAAPLTQGNRISSAAVTVTPPGGTVMSYSPSKARTITATTSSSTPFSVPVQGFWNLSNPKKPYGIKDPENAIDVPMNWALVLADIEDTANPAQCSIKVEGLVNEGDEMADGVQTVFLSGGTPGDYPVTFVMKTNSVPPRTFERTVIIKIEDQ